MKETKLSAMMHFFHISSAELAAGIHVHPSTISRWKTEDRQLKPDSGHFERIIDYVTKRDAPVGYKNIEVFLKQLDDCSVVESEEQAWHGLRNYLIIQSAPIGRYYAATTAMPDSDSLLIYQSAREKREAILGFLDHALTVPSGAQIDIMIAYDVDKFLGNPEYYAKWTERLHRLVEHGHHINFIYGYKYKHIINCIRNFFWLYAHDNVRGYTNPRDSNYNFACNMFIIGNRFALTDMISTPFQRKAPLFSFTNPMVIGQLEKIFRYVRDNCHPVTGSTLFRDVRDEIDFISKRIGADGNLYIYDYFPFCFPVPEPLIRAILVENGFDEPDIQQALRRYGEIIREPMLTGAGGFTRRFILNINTALELSGMDSYVFPTNLISPKPILIQRKHFHKFFDEILAHIEHSGQDSEVEFAVCGHELTGIKMDFMSITKEGLFTYVYPYFSGEQERGSMLCSNEDLLADAWQFYDELWSSLPYECRNKNHVTAQIKHLIKSLK